MTADLVGTRPNESSGQCPTCSSCAEKLAELETKLAKSEAERDRAVVKLAERDAEKLSLEQRVDELERGASMQD